MKVPLIDTSKIDSMLAQLRTAAAKPAGLAPTPAEGAERLDFASALKATLDQVDAAQKTADDVGQRFAKGDADVTLADVMISGQKASIALQATVQVRNKFVSAYQDMMNLSI